MPDSYDHKSEWLVYAIDWKEVIAHFVGPDAEREAKRHAEILDGMALRCIARKAPYIVRDDDSAGGGAAQDAR